MALRTQRDGEVYRAPNVKAANLIETDAFESYKVINLLFIVLIRPSSYVKVLAFPILGFDFKFLFFKCCSLTCHFIYYFYLYVVSNLNFF